ncbi:MAG: hypothetical protein Q9172_007345 [Xanthocarpia lactea]
MPSPERQSPRAAIREWLSHTDPTTSTGTEQNAFTQSKRREGHSKGRPSTGRHKSPRPKAKEAQRMPNDDLDQPQKIRGRCLKVDDALINTPALLKSELRGHPGDLKDGRNVAEQLGLHAPFRSFASRSADMQPEPKPESHRHKRRRKSSSSASYLEPRVYPNASNEVEEARKSLEPKQGQHRKQHTHMDLTSHASSTTIHSPEKPAKTYERRSRHKTREDHYDLPKDKKRDYTKEAKPKAHHKPKKKRKGVGKSGGALMQKFSAKNVDTDRLTLKTTAPVGLFGKGRASSPVRRKGLPDLSFSEVNFLSHGRRNQEENVRSEARSKRRREDKAADAEAEFSRFFASSKDLSRTAVGITEHGAKVKGRKSAAEVLEDQGRSSLPPVDLPEKPFLGFGSCGPGHVSPVMLSRATVPNDFNKLSTPHRRRQSLQKTPGGNCEESPPSQSMEMRSQKCSRTAPTQYDEPCRTIKKHVPIGRSTSAPERHAGADKISAEVNRLEVSCRGLPEQQQKVHKPYARDNAQLQDVRGVDSDLASLLASPNRPELLGAVLDLLLGRTSAHNVKFRQSPKRSEIASSKEKDYIATPEPILGTQMRYGTSGIHGPDLPQADSNLPNHPERTATVRQMSTIQRSQSSGTNKSKASVPTIIPTSRDNKTASETNKPLERPRPSHLDQLPDRPSRVAEMQPDTSNAWTGYGNVYQEQLNRQTRMANWEQDYENVHADDSDRHAQAYKPAEHTFDEGSRPGFAHRCHRYLSEEDPSDERYPNHGYPLTHEIDNLAFAYPKSLEAISETFPQQQGGNMEANQEAHPDFLPEAAGELSFEQIPFEQHSNGLSGEGFNDGADVSRELEPPAFLGGRGFLNVDHYPPWGPRQPSTAPARTFELVNHADKGDAEIEDQVPLVGFWKPNKLY